MEEIRVTAADSSGYQEEYSLIVGSDIVQEDIVIEAGSTQGEGTIALVNA